MSDEIKQILHEIGGFGTSVDVSTSKNKYSDVLSAANTGYIAPKGGTSPMPSGGPCDPSHWKFTPAPWQVILCERAYNLQDTLVNIAPAAGKTTPIISGWKGLVGKKFRGTGVPKILWVCPTAQLASQVYHVDMKQSILEMIHSWSGEESFFLSSFYETLPPRLRTSLVRKSWSGTKERTANEIYVNDRDMKDLQYWINEVAVFLQATGQTQGNKSLDDGLISAVCTYEYAPKLCEKIKPEIVVIDEIQEYTQPSSYNDEESMRSKAVALHGILRKDPKCMFLMTGSMNSNVASQICEMINKYYGKRNLELVDPQHESTKNRAQIQVVPSISIETHDELASLIKDCVRQQSTGNAAIVFSVRSESGAQYEKYLRGIRPIADKLIKQLPRRSIQHVCKITSTSRQNSSSIQHQTLAAYAKKYQDRLNDSDWLASELTEMLKPSDWKASKKSDWINKQYDYLLAESIMRGFGFIIGSGAVQKNIQGFDPEKHARSLLLTQKLFENGNIHFLMGTNAIGVGATLTIKNMYLPSLKGFFGGRFQALDDSSLVQIINRLGRKSGISATLHCSPNDYDTIVRFMFEHPQSQVSKDVHIWQFNRLRIMPERGRRTIESAKGKLDPVNMLISALKLINSKIPGP